MGELKASAATSAGLGYLFVCDKKYVHMFDVNTGFKYLGVLLKAEDHGLGELKTVRWSDGTSSLLVVHCINSKYSISVVKIQL